MTVADLRALLADYPDDTLVLDGRHHELHSYHVESVNVDDWSTSTREIDEDGAIWESPGIAVAVSIGRRY